jgi:hypothetical protein
MRNFTMDSSFGANAKTLACFRAIHFKVQTVPYQHTVRACNALQENGAAHGPRQAGNADYHVFDESVKMDVRKTRKKLEGSEKTSLQLHQFVLVLKNPFAN